MSRTPYVEAERHPGRTAVSLFGTARRVAGRSLQAVGRLLPSTVVLIYHRVAELTHDPQLLSVTPENFADHMSVVADLGTSIPLRHLARTDAHGRPPRRGVVVTFDDGYADNLEAAEPILRRTGVPATVFVSTGGLETGAPFWWDELETLLLRASDLPPAVSVALSGQRMHWDLRSAAAPGDDPHWDITAPDDPTERHAAYRTLHSLCREMRADQRERVLAQLRQQISPPATPDHARRLTGEQVATLAASPVFEVGAHGVTHSVFNTSSRGHSRWELEESRRELAELTGRSPELFAYPFGAKSDLTPGLPRMVQDCGFTAACVNWPGRVWCHTDRYRIPRFVVRDWSAQEFADRLERWLKGDVP